jgi:hypothetical protein
MERSEKINIDGEYIFGTRQSWLYFKVLSGETGEKSYKMVV